MNLNNWELNKNDFPAEGDLKDKIRFILNYAILAPSTHNSQPWLYKIKNNTCKVYINPAKILPQADPTGRDLYISIGCFLENLIIAAKYFGIYSDIKYKIDSEENLVAEVFFSESDEVNEKYKDLLEAISNRVNTRGIFSNYVDNLETIIKYEKLLSSEIVNLKCVNNKNNIQKIADLTSQGMKMAHSDKEFRLEMSNWMHNNFSNKKDGLPGYSLKMPGLLSFIVPVLISYFNFGRILSKLNYFSIRSAPGIYVLTTNNDDKYSWLEAGRSSERLMLNIIKDNLDFSIYVASIEIGDFRKNLQEILNTSELPQFLLCIGNIRGKMKHTPRILLNDNLLEN